MWSFANKPIKAGTVIGIYPGVIEESSNNDHKYSINMSERYKLNARHVGGVTRFIQHMPYSFSKISASIKSKKGNIDDLIEIFAGNDVIFKPQEIQKLRMLSSHAIKRFIELNLQTIFKNTTDKLQKELSTKTFLCQIKNLATANLLIVPIVLNEITVYYLRTCCDINPGEQLGLPYGPQYWEIVGVLPRYFYKDGSVIPLHKYLPDLQKILIKYQIPTDQNIPTKEIALRRASANGDIRDVKILLEYGALINSKDNTPNSKKTALHWAVIYKHEEIEQLLIARGADPNIVDADDKTALQYKDSQQSSMQSSNSSVSSSSSYLSSCLFSNCRSSLFSISASVINDLQSKQAKEGEEEKTDQSTGATISI